MLLPAVLMLTACVTPTSATKVPYGPVSRDLVLDIVCDNLVPIAGKATDDPYTRLQVKRQNRRVLACPPEMRRGVEP